MLLLELSERHCCAFLTGQQACTESIQNLAESLWSSYENTLDKLLTITCDGREQLLKLSCGTEV
jgi:hypothetical protein